jgi:hypothetical protein
MRLLSAIIVSGLILIPNPAWSVPDDAPTQKSQDRNPIEWFLSDIGSLFATAVKSLDQKANHQKVASTENTQAAEPHTESVSYNPSPNVDFDKDLFGEDNFDFTDSHTSPDSHTTPSVASETADKPAQTITDLFKNIFTALSQPASSNGLDEIADNEIYNFDEDWMTSDVNPSATNEWDHGPKSEAQGNDLFSTLEAAAEAYENDGAPPSSNKLRPSVSDFFASIVSAFSGASDTGPSEDVATADEIEPIDLVEAIDEKSVAKEQNQIVDPTGVIDEVAQLDEFEAAPWQVFPHVSVFMPDADIFDESKAPVPAAQSTATMTVGTAEVSEAAPVVRKRAQKNPAARNHLTLGRSDASELPEEEKSFLNHFIETFFDKDTKPADQSSEVLASKIPDHLVPEEKLDLGYTAPDAVSENVPTDELTTIGEGMLKNIDLYLGANTVIGHPYQPNTHASGACIERSLQVSIFCVTDIDWPSEIAESFAQDTAFTLPGEGVIRYENGRVSRVYTPFKVQDFAEVVKFMQRQFGPPVEREIVWMHMIEAPKMPNTTFRWRAVSADRKDSVVLEVRNFDDLRRSFADLNRGMVRLYRDGSRPIFKHLSTMDLMLIQRRRITQAPVVPDEGSTAN